jgi:hypothetical protein
MTTATTFEPSGIRVGVVRGISYGLFGPPGEFVPQAAAIGAGLVRAYLFWSQVEPSPGEFRWDAADALIAQLDKLHDADMEVWVTLCASSPWATRQPTDFLPPSPARDQAAYAEFVRQVVRRFGGRVMYWQCDNEPSNTDLLWAGTAEEYVHQLATMYEAVKEADPLAAVVLGGCGYDVFGSEHDSAQRRFFEYVTDAGRDSFDLFSVHLYGDVGSLPGYLATAREFMRMHGYCKPVVVGDHAGPQPFEFPAAMGVMQQVFASAFADPPATSSTDELAARAGQDTPERRAMTALYDRIGELPPELAMFMANCPPELEERRQRISRRQIVMRTMIALAEGVRRTAYWNLAPEYPGPADHLQMMHLMIGKLPLLGYADGQMSVRHPGASTFELLAGQLAGARAVSTVRLEGHPGISAFEVDLAEHGRLLVLCDQRDAFAGEDEPPVPARLPWPAGEHGAAAVTDAFGATSVVLAEHGLVSLQVSDTPLFVTAT